MESGGRRPAAVRSPILVKEETTRVSGSVDRLAGRKRMRRQSTIEGRTEYPCITSAFELELLDNFFVILVHNRGLRRDQYITIFRRTFHVLGVISIWLNVSWRLTGVP